MLLIDGKPIDWNLVGNKDNAVKKYSAPHTWTIAPHRICYDYANHRIQCPSIAEITEYSSRFCYPYNEPKATHKVVYTTGSQPHPTRQGVMLNYPPNLTIAGGYEEDVVDEEINFFRTHAPWLHQGVSYAKKYEAQTYLYSAAKVAGKLESEAEIKVALLTKILTLKDKDIISMARTVCSIAGMKSGIFIKEEVLEDVHTAAYPQHITELKNGLFRFADKNSGQLRNLLTSKQADIYDLFEQAKEHELLELDREKMVDPVQAMWRLVKGDKTVEICPVTVNERPIDGLVRHLSKPKSEAILEEIRNTIASVVKDKEKAMVS